MFPSASRAAAGRGALHGATRHFASFRRPAMKAIIHTAFGPPREVLQLQEVARPAMAEGDLLVRVEAAGLAKGDWLIAHGLPYIARPSYGVRAPKQPIAGLAFAGTVSEAGAGARRFAPGDEVFGTCGARSPICRRPRQHRGEEATEYLVGSGGRRPVSGLAPRSRSRRYATRRRCSGANRCHHRRVGGSAPSPCRSRNRSVPTSPGWRARAISRCYAPSVPIT